ncbi:hypothetical protein BG015_006673, partial [Linnemannia schmuckeri]
YAQRWEQQEKQNTHLIELVKQLQQQLQLSIATLPPSNPATTSASIPLQSAHPTPTSIHPLPSNPPNQPIPDQFLRHPSNPNSHRAYGRYDDPNRPAPDFSSRIESFTGNQLTLDLDEYLSDIELHFVNKGCPENKKVSSFVGLLKSGARQWAEQYLALLGPGQAAEWLPFKSAFRARWR